MRYQSSLARYEKTFLEFCKFHNAIVHRSRYFTTLDIKPTDLFSKARNTWKAVFFTWFKKICKFVRRYDSKLSSLAGNLNPFKTHLNILLEMILNWETVSTLTIYTPGRRGEEKNDKRPPSSATGLFETQFLMALHVTPCDKAFIKSAPITGYFVSIVRPTNE